MKVKSSRRAPGLKPTEYDHEIVLTNNDGQESSTSHANTEYDAQVSRTTTSANLLTPHRDQSPSSQRNRAGHDSESGRGRDSLDRRPTVTDTEDASLNIVVGPSIGVQAPTPAPIPPAYYPESRRSREPRETAIDILYENERGGFLCGSALFSAKALGGLDATPWTNAYHKPSLTDIHTAQVPDPSWEWAWPEWRVNRQEGLDDFGWEYSFAFSTKFSWHKGKWWNSFVRRRAWTRRRVKKQHSEICAEPHMLNPDYFTVRPASQRNSIGSSLNSRRGSRSNMSQMSSSSSREKIDISDIVTLMQTLRRARIDREKREAVESYLEHATDLDSLESEMHEIMSLFVFQASRRMLLCNLMTKYDEAQQELTRNESTELRQRKDALDAAVRHADEEVRKLAYWSDIKHMVANGESRFSVEGDRSAFYDTHEGIDDSGPLPPNKGKLPVPL